MRKQETPSRQKGFSLIELLIVVAIILIIAAIAILSLLRARINANEAAAVASLRTINTSQVAYQTAYPNEGYAPSLLALGPPPGTGCAAPSSSAACLIDASLASATTAPKSGYLYAVTSPGPLPNMTYIAGAAASAYNQSGVRSFCTMEDGVIRYQTPTSQQAPVTTAAACGAFSPL